MIDLFFLLFCTSTDMDPPEQWSHSLKEIIKTHEHRIESEINEILDSFESVAGQDPTIMSQICEYIGHR